MIIYLVFISHACVSYRTTAERFSYLSCLHSQENATDPLPPFLPEYSKPLGPPQGPAKEIAPKIWQRLFVSEAGTTVVTYDNNDQRKNGTICWAGETCTYTY